MYLGIWKFLIYLLNRFYNHRVSRNCENLKGLFIVIFCFMALALLHPYLHRDRDICRTPRNWNYTCIPIYSVEDSYITLYNNSIKTLTKVKKDHPRAIYLFAIDLIQWKLTGFMDIPIKTLAVGCSGQLGGNPCTLRPALNITAGGIKL